MKIPPLPISRYTEIENVTKSEWAWGVSNSFNYLYQYDPSIHEECSITETIENTDFSGHDIDAIISTFDEVCF